jgi:hypothetical protein
LGVMVNSSYKDHFKTHAKYAVGKAYKALGAIYNLHSSLGTLPPATAFQLFDSLVVPVLTYACEVWYSPSAMTAVEQVHKTFTKFVLGVKKTTHLATLYGETGRFPLDIRVRAAVIKYAAQLFKRADLSEESPVRFAIDYTKDAFSCGLPSFLDRVAQASTPQIAEQISAGQCRVKEWRRSEESSFQARWTQEVQENEGKLCSYRLIKQQHTAELYLTCVPNRRHRKAICRLRVSSHNLAIEKLRYTQVPRHLRFCSRCLPVECLEDEMHVVLLCPSYAIQRYSMFQVYCDLEDSFSLSLSYQSLFPILLTSRNPVCIRALAKFVSY